MTSTAPKKPAQGPPPQSDPDPPLRPKAKVHEEPPKPTFIIFTMPDQLRYGAVGCWLLPPRGDQWWRRQTLTAETRRLGCPTATVAIFFTVAVGGLSDSLAPGGGRLSSRVAFAYDEMIKMAGVGEGRDEPKGAVGHREFAFSEGGFLLSEEPLL